MGRAHGKANAVISDQFQTVFGGRRGGHTSKKRLAALNAIDAHQFADAWAELRVLSQEPAPATDDETRSAPLLLENFTDAWLRYAAPTFDKIFLETGLAPHWSQQMGALTDAQGATRTHLLINGEQWANSDHMNANSPETVCGIRSNSWLVINRGCWPGPENVPPRFQACPKCQQAAEAAPDLYPDVYESAADEPLHALSPVAHRYWRGLVTEPARALVADGAHDNLSFADLTRELETLSNREMLATGAWLGATNPRASLLRMVYMAERGLDRGPLYQHVKRTKKLPDRASDYTWWSVLLHQALQEKSHSARQEMYRDAITELLPGAPASA